MAKIIDNFGNPIVAGRRYAVGPKRSGGVPCVVFYDEQNDELMLRRVQGDKRHQRVDEVDVAAHWVLIDELDQEIIESPDCQTPEELIDRADRRARHHRDQLDAIERELIGQLDAQNNQFLRDEIGNLIHGDGRRDKVVELAHAQAAIA